MNYKRLKAACYTTNVSMAAVGNLTPLLLITFRTLYGVSYTQLGLLVLVNFCTQLFVDIIFSFFSKRFNIPLTVRLTPLLTLTGLLVFAAAPVLFPGRELIGLITGTVIFSASGGLSEVLISPIIAAIPSHDPESEMSRLHSVYAWGVVFVVLSGTVFLYLAGQNSWQWLACAFAAIPLTAFVLFSRCEIPELRSDAEKNGGAMRENIRRGVLVFVLCIFLGGASECVMSQWCSGFIERALGIPKLYGDILGVAMFAATLGLGRSLYAKFGKNLGRVMFLGSLGAAVCYLTAALSGIAAIGLAACALTGFCVSMLWPGSLIKVSEHIPGGGVAVFALMAAGGDLGAAAAPQLMGLVTDGVMNSDFGTSLAVKLGIEAEQLAMKTGMLTAAVFPIAGAVVVAVIMRKFGNKRKSP